MRESSQVVRVEGTEAELEDRADEEACDHGEGQGPDDAEAVALLHGEGQERGGDHAAEGEGEGQDAESGGVGVIFGGGGDLVIGDSHTLVLQTGSEIGEQCLVGLSGTGGGVDGHTVGVDGDAADLVPVEDGVAGVLRGGVGGGVEGAGLFLVEGGGDLADGRLRAGDKIGRSFAPEL